VPDTGAGVERYEQLRRHAIDGEPCGFRLGLALLERHGVIAWSREWESTIPTRVRSAEAIEPVATGVELVGVLASMALAAAG
jgi:hypothetical protein